MRCPAILLVAAAAATMPSGAAVAAPAADLIYVWAPGADRAPIEAAAKQLGAAVIDRTPAPAVVPAADSYLRDGIAAYETKLDFELAWTKLEQAREVADRTGATGLSPAQLADLFLYRGLVQEQRNNQNQSWDELVVAARVDPTRVLDKGRFPPKVVDQLVRANAEVNAMARAKFAIDVPATCSVTIDGRAPAPALGEIVGPHWVNVRCPDRAPWGARYVVVEGATTFTPPLVAYPPPTDTDALVQARAMGARAVIVAEVRGQIATARLIGMNGHERDRRSVTIASDLRPLADAIRVLGAPRSEGHWYTTKGAWAAGAAALAAAVLVPVTAAFAGDNGRGQNATIRAHPGGGQ